MVRKRKGHDARNYTKILLRPNYLPDAKRLDCNDEIMKKYMRYKGQMVVVIECAFGKFQSLQLDAKRIMGMEPAKNSVFYLEPPQQDSDTWKYAWRILALEWPVSEIWASYWMPINSNELTEF